MQVLRTEHVEDLDGAFLASRQRIMPGPVALIVGTTTGRICWVLTPGQCYIMKSNALSFSVLDVPDVPSVL